MAEPLNWDGKSKALEPTPGQTERVWQVFSNQEGESQGQVWTVDM